MYTAEYENVMGTSAQIKIAAISTVAATRAENKALAEIDRLNKILSGYDANSEFSHWLHAASQPVKISPELMEVFILFDEWHHKTHGALDASAETIGKVWKNAARQNRKPSDAEIYAAVAEVKTPHWKLDKATGTAQRLDNAPLLLNTFVKSYVMDKAAGAAMSAGGVNAVVLNIGGDILVKGGHTERINVSDPKADAENDAPIAGIDVTDQTVATSGNYRRGELVQGKWYSHIVDPRTGQPAAGVISATVVAPNAVDAGALATAMNVLSIKEGEKLMQTVPGAAYLLITADGRRMANAAWKNMENARKAPETNAAPVIKDKFWDPNYELTVNLELALIEGARVHRPFVAVWVTDADKKPVRSLALWYNKPRWLNEMHAWYDAYYEAFSAGNHTLASTTSATRAPGKYTLKWDGKDEKGNLVKPGKYTIYIEAAREHGTYQLISQEMEFKKPQQIALTPNTEVASASLDYHKIK